MVCLWLQKVKKGKTIFHKGAELLLSWVLFFLPSKKRDSIFCCCFCILHFILHILFIIVYFLSTVILVFLRSKVLGEKRKIIFSLFPLSEVPKRGTLRSKKLLKNMLFPCLISLAQLLCFLQMQWDYENVLLSFAAAWAGGG